MTHKSLFATFGLLLGLLANSALAEQPQQQAMPQIPTMPSLAASAPRSPTITPQAPNLSAKSYVLMDAESGKILAMQNAHQRVAPASLTKMMTAYVISHALKAGTIHLNDQVPVSEKAWRTGGSRMFIQKGTSVSVSDLLQGIIVESGNDACVAMAEFMAGTEEAFVSIMNQHAAALGMKNTHYIDSTGLPDPNHYTTAWDMSILARALIYHFPEDYKRYSQQWFTYNNIKQPNRNRLLWRDPSVDGIKTGFTDDAGYCLAASAKRAQTRLISILMGARTESARAEDSMRLLNFGFRFFETHKLYPANKGLSKIRVWHGKKTHVLAGVTQDLYVSIPPGQYHLLKAKINIPAPVTAPVKKGQAVGSIDLTINENNIMSVPLVALEESPKGHFWTAIYDNIALAIDRYLGRYDVAKK